MAKSTLIAGTIAAQNRKARHDYSIDYTVDAGIMLVGTEVKSLRTGRANITESYAGQQDGELYLFNAYIPEYQSNAAFGHETRRPRKLLVHRRELRKLLGAMSKEGMTLIPLSIFFNERGIAKVQLGVAKGKKAYDKRAAVKEREWNRDKARLMRDKG
ncbi:SsrA-binding protein SmpB [Telmatospirillum sp. J64-1]|uniref:SsrA-binding protein SmpB n=1 Tax=Telmatospirillum sp. J64-1 TaxID=2502183 RepID=UPI00115C5B95|nr:SsrA-binding protein SmpB [Telmatospirillum sp. J64-1]